MKGPKFTPHQISLISKLLDTYHKHEEEEQEIVEEKVIRSEVAKELDSSYIGWEDNSESYEMETSENLLDLDSLVEKGLVKEEDKDLFCTIAYYLPDLLAGNKVPELESIQDELEAILYKDIGELTILKEEGIEACEAAIDVAFRVAGYSRNLGVSTYEKTVWLIANSPNMAASATRHVVAGMLPLKYQEKIAEKYGEDPSKYTVASGAAEITGGLSGIVYAAQYGLPGNEVALGLLCGYAVLEGVYRVFKRDYDLRTGEVKTEARGSLVGKVAFFLPELYMSTKRDLQRRRLRKRLGVENLEQLMFAIPEEEYLIEGEAESVCEKESDFSEVNEAFYSNKDEDE